MFTIAEFKLNTWAIKLVLPEVKQAQALYEIIVHDREQLSRFLPWAKNIKTVADEVTFIETMREDTAHYKKLVLVIMANNEPAGMIDLHNIKLRNESAEIGYWLSQKYQGNGIMTEAVCKLVDICFNELDFHQIKLLADHDNRSSRAIAQRLNFEHVALLKDEVKYHGKFCDMDLYTIINAK